MFNPLAPQSITLRIPLYLAAAMVLAFALRPVEARASDGVYEVNQACLVTGCFPGDAPGFPVTITNSGSYLLTSALRQLVFLGAQPAHMIEVAADDVQIDLNGFTLSCAEGIGGSCTGDADGIRTPDGQLRSNIRVVNGSLRNIPQDGIALLGDSMVVEDVQAIQNGRYGIWVGGPSGEYARVARVTAVNNESTGVFIGPESIVRDCIARGNVPDLASYPGPNRGVFLECRWDLFSNIEAFSGS